MIFNINDKSIIYMGCPSQMFTGGPGAIHQCVDHLRYLGHRAYIWYMPEIADPTLKDYAHYDFSYRRKIEDAPDHVLIVPETMTDRLSRFRHIQKAVWWLSAVNHLGRKKDLQINWKDPESHSYIHLAQSHFAYDYLQKSGVNSPVWLVDCLDDPYLQRVPAQKKNQVAYFARKNAGVIEPLIAASPDIKWVAIPNVSEMGPAEVRRILSESKVFVEFGPHPGRDRMPREASIQECCIIIGNRGGAAYAGEFPFSDRYKFKQMDESHGYALMDTEGALGAIRHCLSNYDEAVNDFESYRAWAVHQKDLQRKQLIECFGFKRIRYQIPMIIKSRNILRYYRDKAIMRAIHAGLISDK